MRAGDQTIIYTYKAYMAYMAFKAYRVKLKNIWPNQFVKTPPKRSTIVIP